MGEARRSCNLAVASKEAENDSGLIYRRSPVCLLSQSGICMGDVAESAVCFENFKETLPSLNRDLFASLSTNPSIPKPHEYLKHPLIA